MPDARAADAAFAARRAYHSAPAASVVLRHVDELSAFGSVLLAGGFFSFLGLALPGGVALADDPRS